MPSKQRRARTVCRLPSSRILGLVTLAVLGAGVLPQRGRSQAPPEAVERAQAALNDPAAALPISDALIAGYMTFGKHRQAIPLAEKALALQAQVTGKQHARYAERLVLLASLHALCGEPAKAEPLYRESLEIRKQVLGEEHPDSLLSLDLSAQACRIAGKYAEAERLFRQALQIRRRVLGERHPDYLATLGSLGSLCCERGDYAKAEPLLRQAVEGCQQVLGDQHPDYAASLHNLAELYHATGQFGQAVELFRHAIEIRKRMLGEQHLDYAASLSALGVLYLDMGEYARAEPLCRQALDVIRQRLGEQHPNYALTLNNLATIYNAMHECAKAEPLYRQAVETLGKTLGERHPQYVLSLGNLATLYHWQGQFAKAEPLYQQKLKIDREVYGDEHPRVAVTLHNLATLYIGMQDYAHAEPLFRRAIEISEKTLGTHHPDSTIGFQGLILLHQTQGNYAEAAELARRAAQREASAMADVVGAVSEAEALNFAARHGPLTLDLLIGTWQRAGKPAEELYAEIWARRGLLQRVVTGRHRASRWTNSPRARDLYEQYAAARRNLAQLLLLPRETDPKPGLDVRSRIEALNAEKEQLERQLASEVPEFQRYAEELRRPPSDLTKALAADTAFIDLLEYDVVVFDPRTPLQGTRHYVGFVLSPHAPVACVDLGAAGEIDAAITAWRQEIQSGKPGVANARLRRLVWEPLEDHLPADTATVYLCPDGMLTAVPWAALPGRREQTVLLEDYALAVVPYGPFLVDQLEHAPSSPSAGGLLAVGAVSYDGKPDRPLAAAPTLAHLTRALAGGAKQLSWPPLPGTGSELEFILKLAGERGKTALRGTQASTSAVLADLPNARWAHFATHGFFADAAFRSAFRVDEESFAASKRTGNAAHERRTPGGRNPLVLSGLMFAGANLPRAKDDAGLPRDDGGILTAEAVAALPLDKLELVVLSACDTGLGEVAGGEGVFGLQRAFHMAGTRNVVASLWKVDDQATAALMRLFYAQLWQEGKPPLEALRQAQLAIYRNPSKLKDWATLEGEAFTQATRGPVLTPAKLPESAPHDSEQGLRADRRTWAAFVLSGPGR